MKLDLMLWFKSKFPSLLSSKESSKFQDGRPDVAIKAELFSVDQMERYGQKLARSHKISHGKTPYYLLNRLAENEIVLTNSCHILSNGDKASITPAGEWLLDNFYLIEEQIRVVRHHLPKNFGKGLPQLVAPYNCPRIYDIAIEAISHGDGRCDVKSLMRYISAYQEVTPLTLGELWALPGMLRLAIIENLRRVSIEIAESQKERNLADSWVTKLLNCAEEDPANLIIVIADMARSNPPRTSAFVAELVRRLNGHGNMLALPLTWVEQRLSEVGITSDTLIYRFNQQLAANQLSVSNSISGLRQLSETNWADFAESMSHVEQVLKQDPMQVYSTMHFDTRDYYRHSIEVIARNCHNSEIDVAKSLLLLAQSAPEGSRESHVGYYLIDKGRSVLEENLNVRYSLWVRVVNTFNRYPLLTWFGSLALPAVFFTAYVLLQTYTSGMTWPLWLLAIPVMLVISQFVMNLVSEEITRSRTPKPLPRLDFSSGIPADSRAVIAIPCLLSSRSSIDKLIGSLEVCYLGNTSENLYFVLLTDFCDSEKKTMPEHSELLMYASQHIHRLNRRYPKNNDALFFLLHRNHEWNEQQGVWMGYERKRGKLYALNCWLRQLDNKFSTVVGSESRTLDNIKYVITLDSDTVLPRDTAHKMIAAMAHPLNRPVYDEQQHRVIDGYSILQPRLAEEIPRYGQALYAAICSSVPGNDPYSLMSSDIYQDLFGEGSFVGKGIYDVDMFTRANEGMCPENLVLSHDLLEGCYARSGFLSDVLLYEQYPANYLVDMARRTRWIRGDWQLLNWLRRRVRREDGTRGPNTLSVLSIWKLFDNLRRSLVSASLFIILFSTLAWVANPLFWLVVIAIAILFPTLLALLQDLVSKPRRRPLMTHLMIVLKGALKRLAKIGLNLATLPYESVNSLRAVIVTLWRLNISKRHLHEWTSFEQSNVSESRYSATSPIHFYRAMLVNPISAIALVLLTAKFNPHLQIVAIPLGVLWFLAPYLLCWISREPRRKNVEVTFKQRRFLRQSSREIWSFFDTFVTEKENWLPPDNYQEIPEPVIAHRTSPTNIGLSLLANLTAWDFGYITQSEVLHRTLMTLDTLDKMEHFRGHLYNWYDTQTLKPLNPRYISSVDSGNMAGHLITLRSGFITMRTQPVFCLSSVMAGLDDTLRILENRWQNGAPGTLRKIRKEWALAQTLPPYQALQTLSAIQTLTLNLKERANDKDLLVNRWAETLHTQLVSVCQEWSELLGWIKEEELTETLPSLMWLAQSRKSGSEQQQTAMHLARQRLSILSELEQRLTDHANMDFSFLYNRVTSLLSVGYNCESNTMDSGSYDLLPSEIRLTNFFAIAKNQLPTKSWFALGRLFTVIDKEPALMSWSGSMFEYLMPQLVMPDYPGTLMVQMCKSAVDRQIAWGKEKGVPWGISESGYYAFDVNQNYQYHAFGVPGLGLRRGLGDDMVIAPYASLLALMVAPHKAYENLLELERNGARGQYGFYEALDYTASRLARGQLYVIIRSYMAHHQGMSFLALSHLLLDAPMVQRFASTPSFQSARLLLQERVPDSVELYSPRRYFESHNGTLKPAHHETREFTNVDSVIPEVQLLSNTNYHLMLTQAGGSYSRWNNLALTRWREDATCDNRGTFCYLSDPETGEVWSNTWQPIGNEPENYHVVFADSGAEFKRTDGQLNVQTQIVISPEDDVELRRMTLTHRGRKPRVIEITTYAEIVLAPAANDLAHPAFSNLFVQTELIPEQEAILCHRRPREVDESCPWLFHMVVVHSRVNGRDVSFETDRAKFIGRGLNTTNPQALQHGGPLSNTFGAVLDPIVSIRQRIQLQPGVPVSIDMIYGITEERSSSVTLLEKYRDRHIADRVFELAWSHSQIVLRQLNVNENDANLFNRLASGIVFPTQELRADMQVITRNRRGQSGLWGYAISGDLPIVLLFVSSGDNIAMVSKLIQAHSYWRQKGLSVDFVIINTDMGGYQQELQNRITGLIAEGTESNKIDKPGGIFVRNSEHMTAEDRTLLMSVACIVLDDRGGSIVEQLNQRMQGATSLQKPLTPVSNIEKNTHIPFVPDTGKLTLFNGLGGFSEDGREYHIILNDKVNTPAPWSNVIANAHFGTVISESGQAYTWYENAHEYRLTPWENDPVSDSSGEQFYLRDEESGDVWSPMPLPVRGKGYYQTRHGFGYSVFEHRETGVDSELTVFVAEHAPVKLFILTLTNNSGRTRQLSATGYVEWVLADLRAKSSMHIVTQAAQVKNGCGVLATNHYGSNGAERTAFFAVTGPHCSISGDRREFLGRNGSHAKPDVMNLRRLSDNTGAGLDPCGAVQSATTLIDGDQRTLVFAMGVGEDVSQAEGLIAQFLNDAVARSELDNIHQYWHQVLDKIQVQTPDTSVNLLTNGWLIYQTLACRILARSGYYQSGGAFGFRDQLQDSLSLTHAAPERMKEQILLCASRQFIEGDVQHWWHPPQGNGVRTRCSDDYLWLPLAICHYVEVTGDISILDNQVGYITARQLAPGEESFYEQPSLSPVIETLYQHGERAIEHALIFGAHGLPLMGAGDWNDGMNLVGLQGQGESVWLGFFLYTVLQRYANLCEKTHQTEKARNYRNHAETLKQNLNKNAWDGEWYRRGYFDNGEPLGSHTANECQIDAIAQSWSVLSGAGEEQYSQQAMQSLNKHLVDSEGGLIKLLTPPFNGNGPNPGYIRGYLPGVRENGGQYTHGAIWAVMAFAEMGDTERAWQLMFMINPINHSLDTEDAHRYKVEPYVISADIYAVEPHIGRGGWSWYTGSAGWTYRLITESLLGIKRHGEFISIKTHLPKDWPQITLTYQQGSSQYQIKVRRGEGDYQVSIDGQLLHDGLIPIRDDSENHKVEVLI